MQAYGLRDGYKPPPPRSIAGLELVSAQFAHCVIDSLENTLLAFPMGDMFAHFEIGGLVPLYNKQTEYIPTLSKLFYR
jgi:hypothetical protein